MQSSPSSDEVGGLYPTTEMYPHMAREIPPTDARGMEYEHLGRDMNRFWEDYHDMIDDRLEWMRIKQDTVSPQTGAFFFTDIPPEGSSPHYPPLATPFQPTPSHSTSSRYGEIRITTQPNEYQVRDMLKSLIASDL